jgi:hypothetical protein
MSNVFENREYLVIPVSELTKVDFNLVLETSAETVRKSIDGAKTFVKWDGETPAFVATISGAEGPYTYSEILDLLTGAEWTATGMLP